MTATENLTITRVYRTDKNKQGIPFVSKSGNPYTKIALKVKEYGERWLSGFGGSWNAFWKEGDIIEVVVKKVPGKDGETYLNIERPDRLGEIIEQVNKIAERVSTMEKLVGELRKSFEVEPEPDVAEDNKQQELPF